MAQKTTTLTSGTVPLTAEALAPLSNPYYEAWRRLRRNKASVIGLIVIAFFSFVAIFANFLAPHNALKYTPSNSYRPPMWVKSTNPAEVDDPTKNGLAEFPLGTDTIGRDVFSRAIYGARTSMMVGLIPTIIIIIIGTTLGMISGYAGGWIDNLLMRFTDIIYAFPDLLFFIILLTALRDTWAGQLMNGLFLLFVALAIVSWTGTARLVRGQVLALKEKDFVEAARAIGASPLHIMVRHLLPNSLAPILVAATFRVPQSILLEAILGFIGVGVRPATDPNSFFLTSWGLMLLEGRDAIYSQVWLLIAPAVCIALIMLAFTFVGDGLRDALDPMMKGQG